MLLGEKNPNFVLETRIEGNLSVVDHPVDADIYGNGSVQIDGTLFSDAIAAATPQSSVLVASPLSFNSLSTPPADFSKYQLYASSNHNGRLVMLDNNGNITDLNPLSKMGDIMTVSQ